MSIFRCLLQVNEQVQPPLHVTVPGVYRIGARQLDKLAEVLRDRWIEKEPLLRCAASSCRVQVVLLRSIAGVVLGGEQTRPPMPALHVPYFITKDSVRLGAGTKDLDAASKRVVLTAAGLPTSPTTTAPLGERFVSWRNSFRLALSGQLPWAKSDEVVKLVAAIERWHRTNAPGLIVPGSVAIAELWPHMPSTGAESPEDAPPVTMVTFFMRTLTPNPAVSWKHFQNAILCWF